MNIIKFKKIDSTNTYAKKNMGDIEDKTIISADFQTNGHGRFNRTWVDLGRENIYMTFILKPSETILPVYANLTQYLSIILCRQLEEMGLSPKIKWPNDVLIGGKKTCGILAETVLQAGRLKGIALGIGVNLNAFEDDLKSIDQPATSLNLELKKEINKETFMKNLIENFFKEYDNFLLSGFNSIKEAYEGYSFIKNGTNINVSIFNLVKSGAFEGFDKDGTLIIKTTEGFEKINMGELI